jgi:alkylation response protein AidB-like acyl-CoA dehydrogenase
MTDVLTETGPLAAFTAEADRWVRAALAGAPEIEASGQRRREALARWWQARLAEGGYAALTWPEEFGGRGLTLLHELAFNDVAEAHDAPTPANFLATVMVGPAILEHGTREQQQRFLPGILTGDEVWCIGFSEPDAGSDLASLRTTARRVEGGWRVQGQKLWTSWGHVADRCALLVRTGPVDSRHRGLTCLLAPMADAQVRSIEMINGDTDFNEVWFDDVFVADEDVVGEVDGGWTITLSMLAAERRSIPFKLQAETRRRVDELRTLIAELGLDGDSRVLDRLGRLVAASEALRESSVSVARRGAAGLEPDADSLTLKIRWSRTMQELTRTGLTLCMEGGLGDDSARYRRWLDLYLRSRGNSIESGTDEIVLSIIAEQALALPRQR